MVRLKKELGYEPGCLDNEMNFHQNNFEYEFWAMLTGVDEPAETNNFGGKNLLRRMTDMQLALSCSKVEHSDLVLSLDTAKKEIENARKVVETLNAELSAASNELAILEGQLLTEMLITKGIVISDVRAAVEAGLFDTSSAAPKAKEIIPTTEKGAICSTEENKADNLGITEQEENNDISDS